jgi:hypothetical protein
VEVKKNLPFFFFSLSFFPNFFSPFFPFLLSTTPRIYTFSFFLSFLLYFKRTRAPSA